MARLQCQNSLLTTFTVRVRVCRKVRKTWYQNPEFGRKPGEIQKQAAKQYISLQGGSNSDMHHFLCQTEFHPVFTPSFLFPERLRCCDIYCHCSYMEDYYNYLEPCALNAEFQHFIPRFHKTSLLRRPHSKRG
jgi:hypothetical protein